MADVETEGTGAVADMLSALERLTVHDVSPVFHSEMPTWFMHEPPVITPVVRHHQHGNAVNTLTMNEHSGSHVDAPFHFDADGRTMAQVPVDALLLRPYRKFDLSGEDLQPGEVATADQLQAAQARAGFELRPGDVAIVEFGWDRNVPGGEADRPPGWWGANQPGLSLDACEYLAAAGLAAIASDTAACDVATADGQVISGHGHTDVFLPRGILIVEGLTGLASVPPTGLFLALPLKIEDGTGSPTQIVLLGEQDG